MVKRVGLIIWWKNLNCFQRQEKEVDQKTVPDTDSHLYLQIFFQCNINWFKVIFLIKLYRIRIFII